jgi:long-subunit fatty acid transport protein
MSRFLLFAVLLIILISSMASGQTTEDAIRIFNNQVGFGTRALGMGGAYLGIAEDYSAVFWNPAGLVQIRRKEFWTGLSHHNLETDVTLNNNLTPNSRNATKFNSLGMVYPVSTKHGKLAFAIGYQKINNFDINQNFTTTSNSQINRLTFQGLDPEDPGRRFSFYGDNVNREGQVNYSGSINQVSIASALGLSPNIAIGVTLNFWSGKNELVYNFYQYDAFNVYSTAPADFNRYSQENVSFNDYASFNAKFGTLFNFGRFIRLGIGIEGPQKFYIKDEHYSEEILSFDDGGFIELQDSVSRKTVSEYGLTAPFRLSAGGSISLLWLLLSGSAEYMDWTQFRFEDRELLSLNKDFYQKYRPTLKVRTGAELRLPIFDHQVRAGLVYDPTPIKGRSYDFDRKYVSAGYSLLIDKLFKIDLAYMIGFWKELGFDELTPEGRAIDINFHQFFLNFSVRM